MGTAHSASKNKRKKSSKLNMILLWLADLIGQCSPYRQNFKTGLIGPALHTMWFSSLYVFHISIVCSSLQNSSFISIYLMTVNMLGTLRFVWKSVRFNCVIWAIFLTISMLHQHNFCHIHMGFYNRLFFDLFLISKFLRVCRIWGSHSSGYEAFCLLGCNTI
jgi:hypothetical protein